MRSLISFTALALLTTLPAVAGEQSLIEGPRTIKGLSYETMSFQVPGAWMRDPRVKGRLEISGGGKKDLDVLVMRDSSLASWEKKRRVDTLFAARRGTV